MEGIAEINRILDRWLLRYRLQRAAGWSVRGLLAGLTTGIIVALWPVPRGWLLFSQFLQVNLGLTLASLLISGLAGFLWPVNRVKAILFFDRRFNLQERISTAIEFSSANDLENILIAAQRQDALTHARQIDLKTVLPWRIAWLELGAALILIVSVVGLTIRNQPYFLAAMQKQNLIKQIQEQAAGLEEIRSNIQKLENLTPEQRSALDEPLDEAARRLESAQSLEEALSALDQAEQALQAIAPADLQNQARDLQQAGQAIPSQAGDPLKAFGENLAQGNYAQAAQELGSLDPADMSAEQQSSLVNDLQTAADAFANSSPELAQSLQDATDALQSGDPSGAAQALSQAAQNLGSQAGELTAANAAGQAAAQLDASQQTLAQAGSAGGAQTGSGAQATSSSQATGGENNGQNTGQGTGNSQGSSGAGQGESQGSENSGNQAGTQPIETSNQPGDGGELSYESIYAPERLGNIPGQDLQLPGSGQPGEVVGQAGQAPGTANQSLIPYMEVYPAYESVARQAIESGQIPQHLRALVRDYFSSLAP